MAEFDDDYDVSFLTYKFKKPDYTETQEKPLNNFLFTDFMDVPIPTIDYSVSNSNEKEDDDKIEDPVKEDEQSKVFRCKHQFRLTKIYRQSEKSGLKDILQTLRESPIHQWNNCEGEDGSLFVESKLENFCRKAVLQGR